MLTAKLFFKDNEKLIFGPGSLELLKEVRESPSLRQAAIKLGMSYRWAWGRLHKMEQELGIPLLATSDIPRGGRPKVLTPEAHALIRWLDKAEQDVLKVLNRTNDHMPGFLADSVARQTCRPGGAGDGGTPP